MCTYITPEGVAKTKKRIYCQLSNKFKHLIIKEPEGVLYPFTKPVYILSLKYSVSLYIIIRLHAEQG